MEAVGFDPQTSPPVYALTKSAVPMGHTLILIIYVGFLLFKFILYNGRRGGPGWGLAPAPGHTCDVYTTMPFVKRCARQIGVEV
jgi:hypothetical protein